VYWERDESQYYGIVGGAERAMLEDPFEIPYRKYGKGKLRPIIGDYKAPAYQNLLPSVAAPIRQKRYLNKTISLFILISCISVPLLVSYSQEITLLGGSGALPRSKNPRWSD
jgi:hypothetical protein